MEGRPVIERQPAGYILFGTIIDGAGAPPFRNGAVVVEGARITWVGPREGLPEERQNPAFRRIDLPNRTIMPGLIDGHVHVSFGEARSEEELALYTPVEYRALKAVWNAKKILRAGVTSAFDAATTYNVSAAVRDSINAGMFEGPRLSVCGRQLTTHQGLEDSFPSTMQFPPGQAGVLVRNRDEILEAIRLQVKDGVDCIKVSGSSDSAISSEPIESAAFRAEEFELIVDETHRLGRQCTVHARSRDAAYLCARAGFDWLMHASFIDDAGIELCVKKNIAITPTLTLLINIVASAEGEAGASGVDVFKAEIEAASENLSKAFKAGVRMVAGSETGWSLVPYGQWHAKELEVLVKYLGLLPLEAIHAATGAAAFMLPRWAREIGTIEPGKLADILIVNGDPTKDLTLLQRPADFDLIMQGGRPVERGVPIPERRIWSYEKHRTFLPGRFMYNPAINQGEVVP
jgi:imidazolonepropionase-like amidohydrolase